jgi:hypothetical protein
MAKTATAYHPKDLAHGDRVTIEDGSGNELTGLLRRKVSDNQLEISLTMSAFGKEIRVATWKAGTGVRASGKWTGYFPVTHREATLW